MANSGGTIRSVARRLALAILTGVLCVFGLLATFQRSLMYCPTKCGPLSSKIAGFPENAVASVIVPTHDGLELSGWHLRTPRTERLVLFFHGNGGHRGHRVQELERFAELGLDVLMVDYRGYAENEGSPNERDFARDARAMWDYARETLNYAPNQIVLYGESLGGGVATQLAATLCQDEVPLGGLILQSTFTSMVDAAGYHFPWVPVSWLLVDRYASYERIGLVKCPLLMLHGEQDTIVPLAQGRKLFELAPGASCCGRAKRFVPLKDADHNDVLERYGQKWSQEIGAFVAGLTPAIDTPTPSAAREERL